MERKLELAEEYFLPEDSFNAKCTLGSEWDSKEIAVDPEIVKIANNAFKTLFTNNLFTHIQEEFR